MSLTTPVFIGRFWIAVSILVECEVVFVASSCCLFEGGAVVLQAFGPGSEGRNL